MITLPASHISVALAFAALAFLSATLAMAQENAPNLDQTKRRFAQVDAELNKTFDALRKRLRADEFRDLRDRQRKWLEHRDYMAADQPRQNGFDGSDVKESPGYWEAMADLTESRTEFLRAAFDETLPKGITGFYQDSYGGDLKLQETPKGFAFSINVVGGPTSHTGGLTGVASKSSARPFTKSR